MKVGSLVVCVDDSKIPNEIHKLKNGGIYTVVSIREYGLGIGICVEEVKQTRGIRWSSGEVTYGNKIPYNIKRFKVIGCPPSIDIEEIIELEQV